MQPLSIYINESLRKLGKGEEGTVYDLGDGRVKKVFSRGRVPLAWQLLYRACEMGVEITALPKVYDLGEDYIIREDCKPNTPKCKAYYKVSQDRLTDNTVYRDVLDGNIPTHLKGIYREVVPWLCKLKYELSQVGGEHAGLGDFALKNLGETKDGRVVMLDF